MTIKKNFQVYSKTLTTVIQQLDYDKIEILCLNLIESIETNKNVFIFGNGGSAANAMHIANDFIYGISPNLGKALKINALPSNSSVVTCLANDLGYESVFLRQLNVLANKGDIVIALSGSGNSPNIIKALEWSNKNEMKTFAILGFDGGIAKTIAQNVIHVPIDDMQISEDLQLIICHMIMQALSKYLLEKNPDIT